MNNDLKEMLQSVIQEALEPIQQELQNVKSQMNSRFDTLETKMSTLEARMSTLETKMELGFEETKEKLLTIEAQTAQASELESPVHDLQQQVKDHDADIKLIKRVLTNQ